MEPVTKNLPVIALRGLNIFPRMNTSFDLEREISVRALERAMERSSSSRSANWAWNCRRKRTFTRSAQSRA